MKYLYVCALIVVGSCSYAIGQERLTLQQRQQREQASIEKAARVRAGRAYDDMTSLQKLFQFQQWLDVYIYKGLITIQAGEAASEPYITIEEVRAALNDLHKGLDTVNSKPDSDEYKLKECDRIWALELMNLITFKLLPAQDAGSMIAELDKFKNKKPGN